MTNARNQVTAHLRTLIDTRLGSYDAAAEHIFERTGEHVSIGSISKRQSGLQGWPVEQVMALEEASGAYPVTRMMARRVGAPVQYPGTADLTAAAGVIAKEAGEAVHAVLAASASASNGENEKAVAEIDEAIAALRAARNQIEAPA